MVVKNMERYLSHKNLLKNMYSTLNYFRIGDARLRYNAVHLLTILLVEGSHFKKPLQVEFVDRTWIEYGIDPEAVCTSMAKLLSDPDTEVRTVTSANLGKVFVMLGPKKLTAKSSPTINHNNPFMTEKTEENSESTPTIVENGID